MGRDLPHYDYEPVDRWSSIQKVRGVNASCTNLNAEGTRVPIRAALHEGATRDEILMVLKMAPILSIHSCAVGGPIVLEEGSEASLDAAGVGRAKRLKKAGERTPEIDKMKALINKAMK